MNISDFDYDLPEERIARFPLGERDASRLLVWKPERRRRVVMDVIAYRSAAECKESTASLEITETIFENIGSVIPSGSLLIFNNTRVVRARLVMYKPAAEGLQNPGARIEVLCLEPFDPIDYERAFAARGRCEWSCMVGGLKKWKSGPIEIHFTHGGTDHTLRAWRVPPSRQAPPDTTPYQGEVPSEEVGLREQTVRFEWDADLTFGELLELLGRVPIPPYLNRDSEAIDNTRYQTVYAAVEGSVAAPTAGLHFTPELIEYLRAGGVETDEVTLHVGAGTFLPVKSENALDHTMHTEHFEVTLATLEHLLNKNGSVIAVGTTSVRTLESLPTLAWRIARSGSPETGDPEPARSVGQFEPYDIPEEFDGTHALETLAAWMRARGVQKIAASTRIMITPRGFRFRIVNGIVTNFHQPKSTLLLLIAAFTEGETWRRIYDHALKNNFRFLSYGDSSLLLR